MITPRWNQLEKPLTKSDLNNSQWLNRLTELDRDNRPTPPKMQKPPKAPVTVDFNDIEL